MTMPADVAFGDPIASRALTNTLTGEPVTVDIGSPRQHDRAWICPYRILGLGEPITGAITGVDSIQALEGCVLIVGDVLANTGHPVNFHGGDPGFRRLSQWGVGQLD